MALGTTNSAASGIGVAENVGAVPVCRVKVRLVTVDNGNTVREPAGPRRKFAGAGVPALIWPRIFSRIAVALWVVNTLAPAIASGSIPAAASASSSALR